MSKLELFRAFVNERLGVAALEIFRQYEKTLGECQDEINRYKNKITQLQNMSAIEPEKPHRTASTAGTFQGSSDTKEEEKINPAAEQLQRLDSDPILPDSKFTPPKLHIESDPEDYFQPATNIREIKIKVESEEEEIGTPDPVTDSQLYFGNPGCSTALGLDENGGQTLVRPIPTSWSGNESEEDYFGEAGNVPKDLSQKGELVEPGRIPTGDKTHQCEQCGKYFKRKSNLVNHRRVHTGEKPYKCEECNKYFREKSDLKKHRRIHTGEKPYTCDVCGKAFNLTRNLNLHRRIHTKEKSYQCDICNKAFNWSQALEIHRRIHTGEKPHQCEECGKSFNVISNLILHRKIHTGEKSFQCDVCEKAFYRKRNLDIHKRSHTGEKPYTCVECGGNFITKSNLDRHRKIHLETRSVAIEAMGLPEGAI